MRLPVLLVLTLLFAAACAPPISRPSLQLVDPELTFAELIRDPERHIGRYLLLGGAIATVRSHSDGSELEVVQLPTNHRGRITATSPSAGRFLARDATFRDPDIYRPGRLVTLVAQVTGSRTGRIGEMDYRYPVLTVHELRLWAPGEHPDIPRVRFGLGIGIGISR
jgi:outer membrane lipoprotein